MLLTFSGSSDLNSGLNPPISASRSRAGWVRASGMNPPGGSVRSAPSPVPRSRLTYRSPIRSAYRICAEVDWNSGRDLSTFMSTITRWPLSVSFTPETLPTSTPPARTNWPAFRPLPLLNSAV